MGPLLTSAFSSSLFYPLLLPICTLTLGQGGWRGRALCSLICWSHCLCPGDASSPPPWGCPSLWLFDKSLRACNQ